MRHHVSRVLDGLRSLRTRLLAMVLMLTALGLFVSGLLLLTWQRSQLEQRIEQAMVQELQEFRLIAAAGDPSTGDTWADLNALFDGALSGQVPDTQEELTGLVDGQLVATPNEAESLLLAAAPDLLAQVSQLDEPARGRTTVDGEPLWWTALPVRLTNDPRSGTFLVAWRPAVELRALEGAVRNYAITSLITLGLVGAIGWGLTGRALAPVREVREAARRISDTDLGRRIEVQGSDDVSALAIQFNDMLDRLERAFVGQRQFLDDAGHELRTPITVVRGHLELLDAADPHDVDVTRDLVLDELDRMSRLVDELVLLAKAQRPDFLQLETFDVGVLVDEVLHKARGMAPRRWVLDHRAAGDIVGDPQRVTQALLQLAANAVRHGNPDGTIALGSAFDGFEVRLWVRDDGPGVAPEDAERIFDRFSRGAGTRGEGSGLGLAIVQAIAQAHGGQAHVEDAPGGGARFVLTLPADPAVRSQHHGGAANAPPAPHRAGRRPAPPRLDSSADAPTRPEPRPPAPVGEKSHPDTSAPPPRSTTDASGSLPTPTSPGGAS